ncbi:Colicin V production protein [Candidatus Omnitrophus magneticus]|uniref:Colicin V production protein n=1 Tax=Candidatus Omnitrophus magneticus TaxID=1609969 RepID=A0A0F0CPH0_9BACT|nr:Colicin V production protein [Candidatus Omnitrophus magneticus]
MNMSEIISNIYWLDIFFAVFLLFLLYKSLSSRVIRELILIFMSFVVIIGGLGYYDVLSGKLPDFLKLDLLNFISYFAIIFFSSAIFKFILNFFIPASSDGAGTGEKLLNLVLTIIRAHLIFGMITILFLMVPVASLRNSINNDSKTAKYFVKVNTAMYSWVSVKLSFLEPKAESQILKDMDIK